MTSWGRPSAAVTRRVSVQRRTAPPQSGHGRPVPARWNAIREKRVTRKPTTMRVVGSSIASHVGSLVARLRTVSARSGPARELGHERGNLRDGRVLLRCRVRVFGGGECRLVPRSLEDPQVARVEAIDGLLVERAPADRCLAAWAGWRRDDADAGHRMLLRMSI